MKETIRYKEISQEQLEDYGKIPSCYKTTKKYQVTKINNGLGGMLLELVDVPEFVKDFGDDTKCWKENFDLTNWHFFVAYNEDGQMVGGCTLATRTNNCDMLEDKEDLAIIWDLRVSNNYQRQGIGKQLFNIAKEYSIHNGFKKLKVECQNTNNVAVDFYHRQGMVLGGINEYAYNEFPNETQLLWYLDL